MIYVVGSGPSGVMCASALLDRGRPVTMLDAGLTLERERRERVDLLRRTDPGEWPADFLREMRGDGPVSSSGVPLKTVYGSDYPYREVERRSPFRTQDVDTRPTLARGGFSSVWGASMLPYLAEDIDEWPVGIAALAPHYAAVCSKIEVAAARDDLAELFPLYCEPASRLEPSTQARALGERMGAHRESLREAGIVWGGSRLAVRTAASPEGPGCIYCGLCLHGCPHGLIYDAASTLDRLVSRGLRYENNVVVTRLAETTETVSIHGVTRDRGEACRFDAERVYLAAGALNSTRIVLESMKAYDRPVTMRDSLYFLLPCLGPRGTGTGEALHTLAQLFVEIRDPRVSPRTVHLQLYTYNDLYRRVVRGMIGPLAGLASGMLSRMILVQGYLHSDFSPSIRVRLDRDGSPGSTLRLDCVPNRETRGMLRRVLSKLRRHRRELGVLPISPFMRVTRPGRGFHSGGTFPMRESPAEMESDVLGRPHGYRRVHVVDATVLPSVPATTITLSVMANAHRIGSADEPA